MRKANDQGKARRRALGAGAAGALAFGLLAHPAVGNVLGDGPESLGAFARSGIGSFTPASVDPRLAAKIDGRSLRRDPAFKFTPAGGTGRERRAVTVAVRVDQETANAVSVRQVLAAVAGQPGASPVRIAPTAFNLGVARGYESFAPKLAKTIAAPELKQLDMPDLAAFKPGRGADRLKAGEPSRFAPRIALDETAKPGRAPRTLEGQGDYSVDVGGSYRVTRNVAVTAGVRYSPERDRVVPLTDATQDSQAVYVGTQFRF